jgi:hypothetical protein
VSHHAVMRRVAPGISGSTEVARPLRGHGWTQWRAERVCRKTTGHCWHPEGMVGWWCCMCSGETDDMPRQRCVRCLADPEPPRECQGADFSRLLQHLSDNLVEHARRDGLSPARTAVFLSRGGHAPGEACPAQGPPDPVHASYCSWLLGEDCDCGAEQPEGSAR